MCSSRTALIGFLPVLALVCCAHGVFQDGVYTGKSVRYQVGWPLPKSWERVKNAGKADVLFEHRPTGSQLTVFADCTDPRDIELRTLSQRMLIDFRERRKVSQQEISVDGHRAVRTHWRFLFQGTQADAETVVLTHLGCSYYLTMLMSPADRDSVLPDFERFLAGFAVLPRMGSP